MAQEKRQSERLRRIIYRWLDLTTLSIMAVLTCVLLQPAIADGATKFSELLARWHWGVSIAAALLVTTMFWLILGKLGGACLCSRWRMERESLYNPPVWAFGIVSFILFCLVQAYCLKHNSPEKGDVGIDVAGFSIVLYVASRMMAHVISGIFSKCQPRTTPTERPKDSDVESEDLRKVSEDPAKLIQWIHKEEPVLTPHEDRFDLAVFARRIVRVLRGRPLKTIGLVGPYGCGKTSILRMVDHYVDGLSCCQSEDFAEGLGDGYPLDRIIVRFRARASCCVI